MNCERGSSARRELRSTLWETTRILCEVAAPQEDLVEELAHGGTVSGRRASVPQRPSHPTSPRVESGDRVLWPKFFLPLARGAGRVRVSPSHPTVAKALVGALAECVGANRGCGC